MDPGSITITLDFRAQQRNKRADRVTINSQRPQLAAALRGKPADEAVKLLPLMFALCGRAQGKAATLALSAARGIDTLPYLDTSIESEVMREHALRLAMDLPPLLGMSPLHEVFRDLLLAIKTSDRQSVRGLLEQPVWATLLGSVSGICGTDAPTDRLLPSMSANESFLHWSRLTNEFALRPVWQGAAAETGAWARSTPQTRTAPAGFMARWQSRYDELSGWARRESSVGAGSTAGTASAASCPSVDGSVRAGRALVDTARGLLMHEITLEDDLIADYVIVAPTEWNFHPHGRLFSWLEGYYADDERDLRRYVAQCVAALDPCVRWELVLG